MALDPIEPVENSRQIVTNLFFAQVAMGRTFLRAAASRHKLGDPCPQSIQSAERAIQIAEKHMWKLNMDHPHFDQMMAQVELLKFEVANFKELCSENESRARKNGFGTVS